MRSLAALATIAFVVVFMVATVALSVAAVVVGIRDDVHAPAPLREAPEDSPD